MERESPRQTCGEWWEAEGVVKGRTDGKRGHIDLFPHQGQQMAFPQTCDPTISASEIREEISLVLV